jgi:hypothetical protein
VFKRKNAKKLYKSVCWGFACMKDALNNLAILVKILGKKEAESW